MTQKFSKKILASAVTAICFSTIGASNAMAGTLKIDNQDITLGGGAATGFYYSNNNRVGSDGVVADSKGTNPLVSEFLVEISSDAKPGGMGFVGGFGNLAQLDVVDGTKKSSTTNDLQYGYVSYMPVKGLKLDVGRIATNVGYELANSMDNAAITIAALWGAQPVFYDGARLSYDIMDGTTLYADGVKDAGTTAYAVGVLGSAAGVDYAVSDMNYKDSHNIFDVVASTTVADIALGLNVDFTTLADKGKPTTTSDTSAYGVGVYVAPKFGMIDLPIRVEYMKDGTSGVYYGMKSGYTFTVTPTYNISKSMFVRAEVSLVSSDNKIFKDGTESTKTSGAFQMGYRF